MNPTDFILTTTGWGTVPLPAVPGSEGEPCCSASLASFATAELARAHSPGSNSMPNSMRARFWCCSVRFGYWLSSGVAKVVKNGPGCSKYSQGQRVVAVQWPQFAGQGSWQQYVCVPEENLVMPPLCHVKPWLSVAQLQRQMPGQHRLAGVGASRAWQSDMADLGNGCRLQYTKISATRRLPNSL